MLVQPSKTKCTTSMTSLSLRGSHIKPAYFLLFSLLHTHIFVPKLNIETFPLMAALRSKSLNSPLHVRGATKDFTTTISCRPSLPKSAMKITMARLALCG